VHIILSLFRLLTNEYSQFALLLRPDGTRHIRLTCVSSPNCTSTPQSTATYSLTLTLAHDDPVEPLPSFPATFSGLIPSSAPSVSPSSSPHSLSSLSKAFRTMARYLEQSQLASYQRRFICWSEKERKLVHTFAIELLCLFTHPGEYHGFPIFSYCADHPPPAPWCVFIALGYYSS
jgi:hypothetical protein